MNDSGNDPGNDSEPNDPGIQRLERLIADDPWRMACLASVREVMGAEAWIAAGFIRNMVWDRLQGRAPLPLDDVDVVYFDPRDHRKAVEQDWERALRAARPGVPWQVRNQARMAAHNEDAPYRDLCDALSHWLETATGIAARQTAAGDVDIFAAYGTSDLFAMTLRPTPAGLARLAQLEARIDSKGWRARWPDLRVLVTERE